MLSCKELSLYLIEMIKGYNGKSKILSKDSFIKMMSTKENTDYRHGVFWKIDENNISHNGGNYGVICLMSFNKKTGIGKLFYYKYQLL